MINIKKNRGFTLFELLAVMAIMAIISAIAVAAYAQTINTARERQCIETRRVALKQYYLYQTSGGDINPSGTSDLQFLIDAGYIGDDVLCSRGGTYTWYENEEGYLTLLCSEHAAYDEIGSGNFNLYPDIAYYHDNDEDWELLNNEFHTSGSGERRAMLLNTARTDFTVDVKVTLTTSGWGYGIYYRARENAVDNMFGYCFQFDPGAGNRFVVNKVEYNSESRIISVAMDDVMPEDFDLTAQHTITITVSGTHHTIMVDSLPALSFDDDTFSSGLVGLRIWHTAQAVFSSLNFR